MMLIGDGVLGMLRPAAHCAVWESRFKGLNTVLRWFEQHPQVVRACGALEVVAGIWLAERQFARLPARATGRTASQTGQ